MLYDKMVSEGVKRYDSIIADSSEPKTIKDLYDMGFAGIRGVKKRPNYKEDMTKVLQGFTIHLLDGDIDLQREFSTLSWKKDKTGKQLPKLQDGNDHYTDSLIMYSYKNIGVNKVQSFH